MNQILTAAYMLLITALKFDKNIFNQGFMRIESSLSDSFNLASRTSKI